ncbi:hypothetical protein PLESTB_001559800 [Pleodorina starrii]|uniref:Uncharacterized protein n=1 Tax=Pleodorina starrii TaxID=330485 RepID=A0A9W6BXC4_9CHLO|nr:hypothetical protein PLESTB_001559800 [Pleodorina starrii]GLC72798.1 hypothetical protein PLESTF_001294200 [Pleodorina starrii]
MEAKHLLVALLRAPDLCPPLAAALAAADFPAALAAEQLLGRLPPPRRTQPAAAPQTAVGGESAQDGGSGGAEEADALAADSISTWRSLDAALEDSSDREADLQACGFAATREAQLLLLQTCRWAMLSGSPDVRPVHLAHALLVQACFSRFRTGSATEPPAQGCLELLTLLPGGVCHAAILALQEDMRRTTAAPAARPTSLPAPPPTAEQAGRTGGGPSGPASASMALGSAADPIPQGTDRRSVSHEAGSAVAAAADLLDRYSISGLLPSRGALDAIAASLEASAAAPPPPPPPPAPASSPAAVRRAAAAAASSQDDPFAETPAPSAAVDETPPAVRVLCALAALGYRLPPRSCRALVLPDAAPTEAGATVASPGGPWPSPAAAWLTPRLLNDWLGALAFHGLAPSPASYTYAGYTSRTPREDCRREEVAAACVGDAVRPSSDGGGGKAAAAAVAQPCHPWLQRAILSCLVRTTAWELPSLAARLAALAAADPPGWGRVGARATELACRVCLCITPLWNGNRIYQDLIHIGDAMLAMAAAAAAATTTTEAVATAAAATDDEPLPLPGPRLRSPAAKPGSAASGWLGGWAAVELPYQAERWRRKLAARVRKGAGAGLLEPLPREPEWPTYEQAAVLLLQAVRIDRAAAGVAAPLPTQGQGHGGGVASPAAATAAAPRRRWLQGLVLNLLAVLQMQLRTCSAGPQQLDLVRQALVELDQQDLSLRDGNAGEEERGGGRDSGGGGVNAVARRAGWLAAVLAVYDAVGRGGGSAALPASGSAAVAGIVALLPSIVLGQTYRAWVPDLAPQVAAALHAAITAAAPPSPHGDGAVMVRRCMERLHFPLLEGATAGELPRHMPYNPMVSGWRCGGVGPVAVKYPGVARTAAASRRVARPFQDDHLTNLPALPPLSPAPAPTDALSGISAGNTPGQIVRLLLAHLAPTDRVGPSSTAAQPAANRVPQSPPQPPAAATILSPPDSQSRALLLRGPALVALVSDLMSYCPPESLRPEELWVLHVADRDAGLGDLLRAAAAGDDANTAAQPPEYVQHLRQANGGSYATATASSVADTWEAWLDAARDVHLAGSAGLWGVSPGSPPARPRPPPLVSIPTNSPPTVLRPALPPVCRLELLLRRGRYGPVQPLLALMWQGDWFRGDVASLARFSAGELLYVMCAIVHLKELEELAEVDLGWLIGETAAQAVLQLLAAPSMAQLLSSPGVVWGMGPGGPYAPSDLTQEKRIRSQKLLDAAVSLEEAFDRAQQALQYVAATGQSGVLGGGRLDPYRPMGRQGESLAAFEGHCWLAESSWGSGAVGRELVGGGKGVGEGREGEEEARRRREAAAAEGVSIGGLRARRPAAAPMRRWEVLVGSAGVTRLRSALRAMGYDPERWMLGAP